MFGHGATASTPLAKKQYTGIGNDSWESSIESPFEKNDRRLRDMQIGGNAGGDYDDTSDLPTPSLPAGYSLGDESTSTSPSIRPPGNGSNMLAAGPGRPMSSTPKASRHQNASSSSSHITDLRNTPLNAKFPKFKLNAKSPARSYPLDFDDSDDDLLGGMSPPKTMSFGHLPPRVQAINAVAREKTPKKVHADAILNSVMSEMGETEGLYVPSPQNIPDFVKRYSLLPEEMGPAPVENLFAKLKAAESAPVRNPNTRKSMANTSFGSDIVSGPIASGSGSGAGQGQEDDSFDPDDSFSSDGSGTVPPPGEYRSDISYTTNTPGATARYGNVGGGDMSTTHPGRGPSNDSEVFGAPASVPPAQRAELHIMRPGEIHTYMGGNLEDAAGREVDETPLKGQAYKKR
jgi:DASH complex subunit ASK1